MASFIAASNPSTPGKPAKTAASTTEISIAWSQSQGNGTPITNYKVYYSINSAPFTLLADQLGAVTSYTASGLSSGSNYKFKVVAENGVGES